MVLAAEATLLRFKSAAAGALSVARPDAATTAAAAVAVPVAKKSRAAAAPPSYVKQSVVPATAIAAAASSVSRPVVPAAAASSVARPSASASVPEVKSAAVRAEGSASGARVGAAAATTVPVAKSRTVDPTPVARAGGPLPKPSRLIRPEDLMAEGPLGQQRPGFKQPKWVFWRLVCARKDAKQRYLKSPVFVLFVRHRPSHYSTQPLSTDDIHRAKEKQRLKAQYQDQGHGGGLQAKGVEVGAGLGGRSRFDRLSHA